MSFPPGMNPAMNTSELQKKHFSVLREKYQVGQYKNAASDDFLYLILRKAELGIQNTSPELRWLGENRLFKAIEIISLQQYQAEDGKRLEAECSKLRTQYHIPMEVKLSIDSVVYSILWKISAGNSPTDLELKLLSNQGLTDTLTLIKEILNFTRLKVSYKASKHPDLFPQEPLYSILKKLDTKVQLADSEAEWLLESDFGETLEVFWQQEKEKKAELEFSELKSKYQVSTHSATSISSPLYSVLRKINSETVLDHSEREWLKRQNLNMLIAIEQKYIDKKYFADLKNKYKANQYQSLDLSSPLFLILKNLEINQSKPSNVPGQLKALIDRGEFQLSEKDIQWLTEKGLIETAEIAKRLHFKTLKTKYEIVGQLASTPFYEIMLKLEREERLDPKQIIQLIEEKLLSRQGKIALAHYRLEALYYEEEYQRTGNQWNLPSASSNWRKTNQPKQALKVTENVNWDKVRESELKSALWVTRGAAFRDLGNLEDAEKCATQARECHPGSHQPYTLMGAICYDRGDYRAGDEWFEGAVERGAKDTDDEIERIVRMTKDKDKRREVAEYLIKKDPNRYEWAKLYLK